MVRLMVAVCILARALTLNCNFTSTNLFFFLCLSMVFFSLVSLDFAVVDCGQMAVLTVKVARLELELVQGEDVKRILSTRKSVRSSPS